MTKKKSMPEQPPDMMAWEIMDDSQVAEYLGIPLSMVSKLVESGEIPHFRIGKHVRFEHAGILQWAANIQKLTIQHIQKKRQTMIEQRQRATEVPTGAPIAVATQSGRQRIAAQESPSSAFLGKDNDSQ
jgi:excisionase family DNA binding protein